MSEKKGSVLPKFEVIVIGIFFLSFMTWAITRCSATKRKYQEETEQDAMEELAAQDIKPMPLDTTPKKKVVEEVTPPTQAYTPLYATVSNVNVRSRPELKSKIVARIKLFDEVEFMNEVTDFREEITIEDSLAVAPWVRVRTKDGKEGWVYGACVHYYKTKFGDVQ